MQHIWITPRESDCLGLGYYAYDKNTKLPPLFSDQEVQPIGILVEEHFFAKDIDHFEGATESLTRNIKWMSQTEARLFPSEPAKDLISGKIGGKPSKERCIRVCVKLA